MKKKFEKLESYCFEERGTDPVVLEEFEEISEVYVQGDSHEQEQLEEKLRECIKLAKDCNTRVFLSSFALSMTGSIEWLDKVLDEMCMASQGEMSWRSCYHVYWQIQLIVFNDKQYQLKYIKEKQVELYRNIVNAMKSELGAELKPIPVEERNKDFVIVGTCQFLSLSHAPTKTALDRCSTLIRKMNKQVMLINSAEMLSGDYKMPWYKRAISSYLENYLECDLINYQGLKIPFFQCDNIMPDVDTMMEIIRTIQHLKPLYMVQIGGSSLMTELCNELIPTITVATVPSDLTITTGQFQVIGRKLQEEDRGFLKTLGKDESHVIEGRFTCSLPVQKTTISRSDMKASEEDFLCAVVGARLNSEVTEEFVEMMLSVEDNNVKFVFIGEFDEGYEKYLKQYEGFEDRVINIGFIANVLGCLEQCDLYVNPIRTGGGTSVIEAMNEGLPAVSTNFGDVALGAGEAFCVDDYEEMAKAIVHYKQDKQYYNEMSLKAKQRAEEMLDTDKAFCGILKEAERRLGIR